MSLSPTRRHRHTELARSLDGGTSVGAAATGVPCAPFHIGGSLPALRKQVFAEGVANRAWHTPSPCITAWHDRLPRCRAASCQPLRRHREDLALKLPHLEDYCRSRKGWSHEFLPFGKKSLYPFYPVLVGPMWLCFSFVSSRLSKTWGLSCLPWSATDLCDQVLCAGVVGCGRSEILSDRHPNAKKHDARRGFCQPLHLLIVVFHSNSVKAWRLACPKFPRSPQAGFPHVYSFSSNRRSENGPPSEVAQSPPPFQGGDPWRSPFLAPFPREDWNWGLSLHPPPPAGGDFLAAINRRRATVDGDGETFESTPSVKTGAVSVAGDFLGRGRGMEFSDESNSCSIQLGLLLFGRESMVATRRIQN